MAKVIAIESILKCYCTKSLHHNPLHSPLSPPVFLAFCLFSLLLLLLLLLWPRMTSVASLSGSCQLRLSVDSYADCCCWFAFSHLRIRGGMGATKGNRRNWLPQERAKMSPMGKLLLLLLGETESFHAGVIGAVCFFFFAPGISLGNVSRMPVILFPDAFIAVARDERKSHELLLLIIILLLLLQKAMRFFSIPQLQNVLDVGWSRGPSCFLFSFYQEAAGWAAHTAVRRNLSPVLFFIRCSLLLLLLRLGGYLYKRRGRCGVAIDETKRPQRRRQPPHCDGIYGRAVKHLTDAGMFPFS